ncbi:glycoside hydrolase, partial [Neocallimastix californiae]
GTTTRYWDCCKPSCAWPGKFEYKTNIKLCAADGSPLLDNNLISGCEGGPTYTCEDQTPWAVDDVTAYGYAAANIPGLTEADWCCTCYALTFTSFPIKGKQMIVQITNTGGDLGDGHFDLQIPGGGFGLFNGCSPRYPDIPDEDWGDRNGGVISREGCYKLPKSMQEGCLFKFDWFRGADNPDVTYVKVDCPQELLDVSGCTRMNP